ncbi:MAG: Rrf2 family transcriptional regulator [Acidobacteria bacterium]|nr:Rrf2 family transcriptional regulator [Acidobacteriota bacterium]
MRNLSKKTQYSLRALYALGRHYGSGPVLIAKIAQEEAIPLEFLEKLLLDLKNAGFLESRKGRRGGYLLARSPEQITVGAVIRSIEGPLAPLPCASETAFRKCDECVDIATCGTRIVMRQVRDAVADILDNTTIADVIRRVEGAREQASEAESLMYYI